MTVPKPIAKKIRANVPPEVAKELLAEIKQALTSAHNVGYSVGQENAWISRKLRAAMGISEEQAEEWGIIENIRVEDYMDQALVHPVPLTMKVQ